MDLEFREPTEEERGYIVNKTLQNAEDISGAAAIGTGYVPATRKSSSIGTVMVVVLFFLFGFLRLMTQMGKDIGEVINSTVFWTIIPFFIFVVSIIVINDKKKGSNVNVAEITGNADGAALVEARKRIAAAKLKVADVICVKRDKIMTDKDEVFYVEVVDVNSVMGNAVEMHTTKEIYDGFEEGRDAYVVWWDYANSSIGADACEIMLKNII